uniref:Uncharacterized protein n=1 Tax=Strongyloides papillosus TaxID=174720 RepID=A0A0N5BMG1_STREA
MDFYNFLKKLNHVEKLRSEKFCLSYPEIPPNISLPIFHTLRHLYIRECECTKFINQTMINNLLENNKNFNRLAIHSKTTDFEEDVIKTFKRKHDNCTHDFNDDRDFVMILARSRFDYNKEREFRRFFPGETYTEMPDPFYNSFFEVNKTCIECNCNNTIFMHFQIDYESLKHK